MSTHLCQMVSFQASLQKSAFSPETVYLHYRDCNSFQLSLSFGVRKHSLTNQPERKIFTIDGHTYRHKKLYNFLALYVCPSMPNAFPSRQASKQGLSNQKLFTYITKIPTHFQPSLSFQVRNHSLTNQPEMKVFIFDGQTYRHKSLATFLSLYVCPSMENAFLPDQLPNKRFLTKNCLTT